MSETRPKTCFRGVKKKDWVKPNGMISLDAFEPDPRTEPKRAERKLRTGIEVSINWEDGEEALSVTLADRANAGHGALRCHISLVLDNFIQIDGEAPIWCERDRKDDNPYHGNIVFPAGLSKPDLRSLMACVAVHARFVKNSAPTRP